MHALFVVFILLKCKSAILQSIAALYRCYFNMYDNGKVEELTDSCLVQILVYLFIAEN